MQGMQLINKSWVYIVEDDAAVRSSLAMLLQVRGYATVAFDTAEAFLAAGTAGRPACVLVDVRLPAMSGLELQQKLKETGTLPVIVMTGHGDVATARKALRDGAVDFLEKPIDEADLFAAVESALQSDQEQVEWLRERDAMRARLSRLTDRELEVFERVTEGMHNREIAEEFGISQRTVEVHRARLMEKLHARRVADLFKLRFELDDRRAGGARSGTPSLSAGA
jgi:RNA polymerase sigma factor (sigma-70 family)